MPAEPRYRTWTVKETADGILVEHSDSDGNIFPATVKPTLREAAARLLQLMGLGPVAPQSHPERVCIGEVIDDTGNSIDPVTLLEEPSDAG